MKVDVVDAVGPRARVRPEVRTGGRWTRSVSTVEN